jgi:hypothetical protein
MQAGVLALLLRDLLAHFFEAMTDHSDDLLLSFEFGVAARNFGYPSAVGVKLR